MRKNIFKNIQLTPAEKEQLRKDEIIFEKNLEQLVSKIPHPEYGFFGPDSMTWKMYREPGIVLGGLRALFLQIAHPSIAEGVKLFSNFHEEYLYRAHRTFTSMATFYYGNTNTALATARRLFKMHSMIRGTIGKKINGEWKQVSFCAKDPELLTWVLATLVETTITMYGKIYEPLTETAQNQFFEESKTIAVLMGIPLATYPKNLQAFRTYYQKMITGDQLVVGPTAMDLAQIILHPPYGSHRFFRWLAGGFLNEKFAKDYQVLLSKRETKYVDRIIKIARFIINICPQFIRYAPPYHQAKHRIQKLEGHTKVSLGGFYTWLGQTTKFPFVLKS